MLQAIRTTHYAPTPGGAERIMAKRGSDTAVSLYRPALGEFGNHFRAVNMLCEKLAIEGKFLVAQVAKGFVFVPAEGPKVEVRLMNEEPQND